MVKKTLQTLPGEVFSFLKIHKFGEKEFLIVNGISHTLTPVLVCPVKLYGNEMAIGLYSDHHVMVFYLFDTPTPQVDLSKNTVLLEIQGGKMEGYAKEASYKNILIKREPKEYVCVQNNHPLAFSLIWGEVGRLIASGDYLLEEQVEQEEVVNLTPFKETDFEIVHKKYSCISY